MNPAGGGAGSLASHCVTQSVCRVRSLIGPGHCNFFALFSFSPRRLSCVSHPGARIFTGIVQIAAFLHRNTRIHRAFFAGDTQGNVEPFSVASAPHRTVLFRFDGMLLAFAMLLVSNPGFAFMLGDMEQISVLGQPFRARVGFQLAAGESIDPGCIKAIGTRPESSMDVPVLLNARARVESGAGRDYIFLESNESLAEPIVQLTLEVRCDKTGNVTRQYTLLSDPHESFLKAEQPPVQTVLPTPQPADPPAQVAVVAPLANSPAVPSANSPAASAASAPRIARQAVSGAQPGTVAHNTPIAAPATVIAPVRTRKPRVVRDILRLEPPGEDLEGRFGTAEGGCCFRLSYELGEREGAPITEEERDRLRMEYAERMGEGEILQKLLAMRDRVQVLKAQVNELSAQLSAEDARLQSDAQSAQFAWLVSGMAGAAALAAGAWLWWRRTRRERFDLDTSDLFDTGVLHSRAGYQADADAGSKAQATQRGYEEDREPDFQQSAAAAAEMPVRSSAYAATKAPALETGLHYVSARPAAEEAMAPLRAQIDANGFLSYVSAGPAADEAMAVPAGAHIDVGDFQSIVQMAQAPLGTATSTTSSVDYGKVAEQRVAALEVPKNAFALDPDPLQLATPLNAPDVEQPTAFDFDLSDDGSNAASNESSNESSNEANNNEVEFDLPLDGALANHQDATPAGQPFSTSMNRQAPASADHQSFATAEHLDLTFDLEPDSSALSPEGRRILENEQARLSEPEQRVSNGNELFTAMVAGGTDDLFPAIVSGGTTGKPVNPVTPVMAPPPVEDPDPELAARRMQTYRDEYIRERFPEIAAGSIELDKPATVVEGARIMYQEDQDVSRAVGLLELAWSAQPKYVQLWLCLFEIYWLEGMQSAFVDLARRFRDAFSEKHPEWPMIVKLGRELDPANSLFRGAGLPVVQDSTPNWLNAELDMVGHMLSRELRERVLEHAAATGKRQGAGPELGIR